MSDVAFQTVVELGGKTATGFEVPASAVDALGVGKKPAVRVTIRGYTYRSTIASMGGRYMLPLSAQHREGAGLAAGDVIDVSLEPDTAPRVVAVPADLAEALDRDPDAKRFFEGLSYSNKLRHVLSVEDAKTAETRQRRVEKAVGMFREGRRA